MKRISAAAMSMSTESRLLQPDEPTAAFESGLAGSSPFVIVVDHASARIPAALKNLGVSDQELKRHIAWDIGALEVAKRVSAALGAPLIAQNYSRLVIDCNRDPRVSSSIPLVSEHTEVPGNAHLSEAQKALRVKEIFEPYHARIASLLDARARAGQRTFLVAQHSMTNLYKDSSREMHAAILYNRDRRFAGLMLDALRRDAALHIADNEPYFVSDETDYTIPKHGEARGLPHVEIELRQDLVYCEAGQIEWAARLTDSLQTAADEYLRSYP
jgi:predicted N-formylglutamate amidohydrolase